MGYVKLITVCCLIYVSTCTASNQFSWKNLVHLLRELKDEERSREHDPNHDAKFNEPKYFLDDDNLMMCHGAGLNCNSCSQCFPGGWCVENPASKPVCLCNYGWTGNNAEYIENTNDFAWGINRIRADYCDTACHYTHHVRNDSCAGIVETKTTPQSAPITTLPTTTLPTTTLPTTTLSTTTPIYPCHHQCLPPNGKCVPENGLCLCEKGQAGPNKLWSDLHKTYYAEHCEEFCPYDGKPNPGCIYRNIPEIN